MPVDPYASCPCGSGKKLKFCCSDLAGEIEKIHRMMEGEQPRAALRHVEQTLGTHPGRASLLDLKATLELSLDELDAAKETITQFVATNPDSASAHACQALLSAELGEIERAIESLQKALALVEREMPLRVHEALGAVGTALLEAGHFLAAQAHLWLHAVLAPKGDRRAHELLAELNHYAGLPLLLRDRLQFRPWPQDAPWKEDAERAECWADQGKWQQAVVAIDRLGATHGADPALVYNRALLSAWLADDETFVAGLHAFAQMDVPLDDAVEAEAIAQLLDPALEEPRINSLGQTYAINDLDGLVARLISDKRARAFDMDPEMFAQRDQPRPRNTYILLDRPLPETGVGITRDQVPQLAGVMAIYGRQTDRAERLELMIDKGPAFAAAIASLREIGGDALGDVVQEKVIGSVSRMEFELNWRSQPPRDTPLDTYRRLAREERRSAIVERWPALVQPALRNKTAREAASVPDLRIPLLASVMILENGGNTARDKDSIDELREQLGLPRPETIEPGEAPVDRLPLVRVPRLNLAAVSDGDLVTLYRRAIVVGAQAALVHVAREAVRRPTVARRIPPADAYHRLIAAESDPQRAREIIQEAREHAEANDKSAAPWDLTELELQLTSGNIAEAKELLVRIEREHGDDPHVAAALYQLLYEMGIIRDDGVAAAHHHADEQSSPALAGAAAAEPASRIWTPDSERPAGGGKSALWTPS